MSNNKTRILKGFSLVELLGATILATLIVGGFAVVAQKGIVASAVSTARSSEKAKLTLAIEKMADEVEATYQGGVSKYDCPKDQSGNDTLCHGSYITLKVPIRTADPVPNTQYTPEGLIKFGAYTTSGVGRKDCLYRYMVNLQNQLVKQTMCPQGTIPPSCPDGACNGTETCSTCPQDCQCCGKFGCQATLGETCSTCPQDCGVCCPDGLCNFGETCSTCPQDCGPCQNVTGPYCGDWICNGSETCSSCLGDCGNCCGTGGCQPALGETCSNCFADCGYGTNPLYPCCGNGLCNNPSQTPAETCSNCPGDCGACTYCGDGICNGGETYCTCTTDGCPIISCGGGCFLAGTLITMADGSTKPIETLKKGDRILSYIEKSKKFKPATVKKLLIHTDQKFYLIINGYLKVTPNHPVFFKGKLVQIGTLKVGDYLLNEKGEKEMIKTIENATGDLVTYNLSVKPYHTYIAGGIVVHNAGGGDKPSS